MSRIGKNPIIIPTGVTVEINDRKVTVKGTKGETSFTYRPEVKAEVIDNQILVTRLNDEKMARSLHGLTRTLIANMVEGVSKGFVRRLEIQGVGYRAKVTGNTLNLSLGFSHPVDMVAPNGITVAMDEKEKNEIIISGIDKEKVGQFAANVRSLRKPEPYKGKGIRYKGEYVARKAGKTAKK